MKHAYYHERATVRIKKYKKSKQYKISASSNPFLTIGHVDRHYQLRNDGDLRIPLHATALTQLFIRYTAGYSKLLTAALAKDNKTHHDWCAKMIK